MFCIQAFDSTHEFRNGKRYNTARISTMKKNSSEGSPFMTSLEMNEKGALGNRTLTPKEVNEHIKSFIAPITRQLEV